MQDVFIINCRIKLRGTCLSAFHAVLYFQLMLQLHDLLPHHAEDKFAEIKATHSKRWSRRKLGCCLFLMKPLWLLQYLLQVMCLHSLSYCIVHPVFCELDQRYGCGVLCLFKMGILCSRRHHLAALMQLFPSSTSRVCFPLVLTWSSMGDNPLPQDQNTSGEPVGLPRCLSRGLPGGN